MGGGYLRHLVVPLLAHLLQLAQHAPEVRDAVLQAQPLVVLPVRRHQQLPHVLHGHLALGGVGLGPGEQWAGQRPGSPGSWRPEGTWGRGAGHGDRRLRGRGGGARVGGGRPCPPDPASPGKCLRGDRSAVEVCLSHCSRGASRVTSGPVGLRKGHGRRAGTAASPVPSCPHAPRGGPHPPLQPHAVLQQLLPKVCNRRTGMRPRAQGGTPRGQAGLSCRKRGWGGGRPRARPTLWGLLGPGEDPGGCPWGLGQGQSCGPAAAHPPKSPGRPPTPLPPTLLGLLVPLPLLPEADWTMGEQRGELVQTGRERSQDGPPRRAAARTTALPVSGPRGCPEQRWGARGAIHREAFPPPRWDPPAHHLPRVGGPLTCLQGLERWPV